MADKRCVFSRAKNLKSYNKEHKDSFSTRNFNHTCTSGSQSGNKKPYVYITDHLPKEFLDQKKKLIPKLRIEEVLIRRQHGKLKTVITIYKLVILKKHYNVYC